MALPPANRRSVSGGVDRPLAPMRQRAATRTDRSDEVEAQPRRGRLGMIATAISDTEIARQLTRLGRLLLTGEIDMSAPRGSYINFLI